jgi:tetratricopeptide (TPR) repeat protein
MLSVFFLFPIVVSYAAWSCLAESSGTSSRGVPPKRPPFVSHITASDLERALAFAEEKHREAVQNALSRYPVDQVVTDDPLADISSIQLQPHILHTKCSLPDFDDLLPKTAYVTDPATPLLSRDECAHVVQLAQQHFDETNNGEWTLQMSGQYQVAGFYIRNIPAVHDWFLRLLRTKLFPLLQQTFPQLVTSPNDLCVDNTYVFRYTPETGRRTDVHTDAGCLSFTIALNDASEYDGGGTWFDGYGVVTMGVGHVTVRPGGVKHCGYAVENGIRIVLGGFAMHRHTVEPVRTLLTFGTDNVDLLEAAVVLNPNLDAAYNILAGRYEALGRTDMAQTVLEYCLQHVNPDASEVSYALGSIYKNQKRYEEALECMKRCLITDAFDFDAMLGVALCAAAMNDTDTERLYYERIINTPGGSIKTLATAYCNLGVLEKGKDTELFYYRQSLATMPNSFSSTYCLASALAERRQWEEAVTTFRAAVAMADHHDQESQALRSLYKAVVGQMKESGFIPQSREEAVARFQLLMGAENFQKAATMKQQ